MLKVYKIEGVSFEYYEILAQNQDEELIGRLGFEILELAERVVLRNIRVEPRYLNLGVGRSMNRLFEQFSLQNGCREIDGIYYPNGEGAKIAPHFYKNNNYKIELEDLDFLTLSKEIEQNYDVLPYIESEPASHFAHLECEERSQ